MKTSQGISLIEFVMIILFLSILVAVALPKFENLSSQADSDMQSDAIYAVRVAFRSYLVENAGKQPTVLQLAQGLSGNACLAVSKGIQCVLKDGTTFVVPTYTDNACKTATKKTSSIVGCIKG